MEATAAEVEEKNSQEAYEKLKVDTREKRAQEAKPVNAKSSERPSKTSVAAEKNKKEATGKKLMAILEVISSPRAECDWSVQYYRIPKEGRAGEVESPHKAKAV